MLPLGKFTSNVNLYSCVSPLFVLLWVQNVYDTYFLNLRQDKSSKKYLCNNQGAD